MENTSKNMSVKNIGEPTEDLFAMFGYDTAKIFEEIIEKTEIFLNKESGNKDATDSVLDLLLTITDSVKDEFEKLVSRDSNNKQFVRTLSKIFPRLLNTKVDTAKIIRRINEIAI